MTKISFAKIGMAQMNYRPNFNGVEIWLVLSDMSDLSDVSDDGPDFIVASSPTTFHLD